MLSLGGVTVPAGIAPVNPLLSDLAQMRLGGRPVDKIVVYNPDAVALWLYMKYTDIFSAAACRSDLALPMLSVMPSVTPVCFASMYSGVMPDVHGIKAYVKPVLTVKTVFDYFPAAGKKVAIVSTAGDSISKIFLERNIEYFIYDSVAEVNAKADEIVAAGDFDVVVIYNGDYDGTMHKLGPESPEALAVLRENVGYYASLVDLIKTRLAGKHVLYGFCPDHGCHEIDGGCGSHGLDMAEDMNVVHFWGIS